MYKLDRMEEQGKRGGNRTSRLRRGGFARRRRDVGIGQPVDRLFGQGAVDAGLQIEGQQFANARGRLRQ